MDEMQEIQQEKSEREYFTMFPNLYDEEIYNLTPYEFRLLMHYIRRGKCWESTETTARICRMSVGQVSESRKVLKEKKVIYCRHNGRTITVTVKDKWKENMDYFHALAKAKTARNKAELDNSDEREIELAFTV